VVNFLKKKRVRIIPMPNSPEEDSIITTMWDAIKTAEGDFAKLPLGLIKGKVKRKRTSEISDDENSEPEGLKVLIINDCFNRV
jgi:hypothetical protein